MHPVMIGVLCILFTLLIVILVMVIVLACSEIRRWK